MRCSSFARAPATPSVHVGSSTLRFRSGSLLERRAILHADATATSSSLRPLSNPIPGLPTSCSELCPFASCTSPPNDKDNVSDRLRRLVPAAQRYRILSRDRQPLGTLRRRLQRCGDQLVVLPLPPPRDLRALGVSRADRLSIFRKTSKGNHPHVAAENVRSPIEEVLERDCGTRFTSRMRLDSTAAELCVSASSGQTVFDTVTTPLRWRCRARTSSHHVV